MKEHPILMSGPMVRAYLDGRKTQTRRVFKFNPVQSLSSELYEHSFFKFVYRLSDGSFVFSTKGDKKDLDIFKPAFTCPYGKPGDRLWAREAWNARFLDCRFWNTYASGDRLNTLPGDWQVFYRADNTYSNERRAFFGQTVTVPKWLPSIHMPRWASRITLPILNIRVERLQDIDPDDAEDEGIEKKSIQPTGELFWWYKNYLTGKFDSMSSVESYQTLWDSINAKRGFGWDTNPWVWVIEFDQIVR